MNLRVVFAMWVNRWRRLRAWRPPPVTGLLVVVLILGLAMLPVIAAYFGVVIGMFIDGFRAVT